MELRSCLSRQGSRGSEDVADEARAADGRHQLRPLYVAAADDGLDEATAEGRPPGAGQALDVDHPSTGDPAEPRERDCDGSSCLMITLGRRVRSSRQARKMFRTG